jgi:predicted CoA-binding protein
MLPASEREIEVPPVKTIAVLGASRHRHKFGNKCVRAYREADWRVFPVHPTETEIEGLTAFRSLAEVPGELDRISVYLPPPVTLEALPEIARKGAGEVWFNPGAADVKVVELARQLGIAVRAGCSIIDIGASPSRYPG